MLKHILFICAVYWLAMITFNQPGELVPLDFVNGFLKDYSKDEKILINDDLVSIKKICFRNQKTSQNSQPTYVATAGGPGACKSTILETFLHDKPDYVYADPDPRALKFMVNTYTQSLNYYAISQASSYKALLQETYNKWRAASNYISHRILNDAYAKGYNIAHGSTSTAKQITGLYERLKKKDYKIVLILCGAPDQSRVESIQHRSEIQGFVQSSPEDVINKGKAFPERFQDYFHYADQIYIYWTQDFKKGSTRAALLEKGKGMSVYDQKAYNDFVKEYEKVPTLNKHMVSFETLVQNFIQGNEPKSSRPNSRN
ncbi:MAG: hypothetical protein FJX71_02370 [Alphaproteobacteria bacterium]|nr:hypothetical protein [Alphaproteobacteria bacterium]